MDLIKKVKLRNVQNPFMTIEPGRIYVHMFEIVKNIPQREIDAVCRKMINRLWEEDDNHAQIYKRDANDKLVDYAPLDAGSAMVAVDGTPHQVAGEVRKPLRIAGLVTGNADTTERLKELFSKEGFVLMGQSKFRYVGWMLPL